ncbi:LysR substrate-binding domain-containing protein [Methylobacterium trifolii]|uniref:HTH-type transcriptional activator CmpR n=1 Tax=Methylobacterium trifolii TaxID=1003092 RepID=A0ABQ4TYE8_9HYPH|nr:LysR substrate-binding domain-containing protein [Methylobacterium trifolii]GJE59554.1 HTH-type transcriptional activator CmpR [Methylobacterium trifolii]
MRHTQLRAFHAVAFAGSVTAAAHQLNVSQPTLTMQIRSLEEEYAVELFVRTGGRLRLTDAGRQLQAITRRLFAQEAEARHFLTESRELRTGHLRVGAVGPFHATEMLVAFHARYPEIGISVSVGNSQVVLQNLLDFRTDVAVLAHFEEDSRLWVSEYSKDAIVAFGRKDHPLFSRRRKGMCLRELHGQPMVAREHGSNTRRASDAAMAAEGVVPHIVMEIGSREAVREAVASGVGFGFVSRAEYVADRRITSLPIVDAEIYNYARIVCLQDRRNARMISAFIDTVRST